MANFLTVQSQKFKLAGAGITSSAVTIVLQSFKTPAGTDILTADFGAIGYLTIDPGTSKEEVVSFTTVTQSSSDDTCTLTGVTRGLGFTTPYTTVAANQLSHAGGAIVVLSNPSAFYNKFPAKANDEAITGYWTVPTPLSGTDIVNKNYADALAMSGTGVTNAAVVVTGTAGETVAAGNLVYLKAADARWWKTDADTVSTVEGVILGIAQGSGTAGNSITGGVLIKGVDSNQSGLSAGTTYYASNTAGAISSTAGTTIRIIGVAKTTTAIYFDPYFNAAATTLSVQNGSYVYAADSVGTDAYAITLVPAITAYAAGQMFNFKAGTANTGAATLAVNGLTAKAIKKNVSEALFTGDIIVSQICTVIYDGTNFQLLSKTPTLIPTSQVFSGSGTYTKPANLKYAVVEMVGGGGGGGANSTSEAGGGGSGAYGKWLIPAASIGATETVTIGAAGAAGSNGAGGTGGTTSFGTLATAVGGTGGATGGTGGAAGTAGGSVTAAFSFGVAGGASITDAGPTPDMANSGAGGDSFWGKGGQPRCTATNGASAVMVGEAGRGFGAGASGSIGTNSGAAGTIGYMIVTEFY